MATVIARTGIKRDKNHMYYVKSGAVWAVKRKKPGVKARGTKKKVVQFAKASSLDYSKHLYFIDGKGNVAATKRPKRKKSR